MKVLAKLLLIIYLAIFSLSIFADDSGTSQQGKQGPTIANIANNILGENRQTASDVVILLMAVSATLGSAFAMLAILKFKQHKDNPQQTHLGQPFSLFLVAVIFIWLPYYMNEVGYTLTGSDDAANHIDLTDSSSLLCPEGGTGNNSLDLGCPNSN